MDAIAVMMSQPMFPPSLGRVSLIHEPGQKSWGEGEKWKKVCFLDACRGVCHKTIGVKKNNVEPKAILVIRKIKHSLLPLELRLMIYQY
jgi:hypothetical protein